MGPTTILSFDVEEHHRIEAAADIVCPEPTKVEYGRRMERSTRALLELLGETETRATFFVVGEIARSYPKLIRDIANQGHEIGSHSWDHRRVHRFNPVSFREDLLKSKHALEDASGERVIGFRAPTFSVVRQTAWVLDVLRECGFEYDSSIFPVRHDRYGIPDAPRTPFVAMIESGDILELPLATLRTFGLNLPIAGGGYFRLFPPPLIRAGVEQSLRLDPGVAMLYFHPWEFDTDQPRLPLNRLSRFRTYVGIRSSKSRLRTLLKRGEFRTAREVVALLERDRLPRYSLRIDGPPGVRILPPPELIRSVAIRAV